MAKLTIEEVEQIVASHDSKEVLSAKYKVTERYIMQLKNGRRKRKPKVEFLDQRVIVYSYVKRRHFIAAKKQVELVVQPYR